MSAVVQEKLTSPPPKEEGLSSFFTSEGNLPELVNALREGKKVNVFIGGGALLGVFIAAILESFHNEGLLDKISEIRGISTGAAAAYVALSINDQKGLDLYAIVAEEGSVDGSPARLFLRTAIESEKVASSVSKFTNIENLKNSPVKLLIGIADIDSGETYWVDANDYDNPKLLLKAAISPMGISKDPVTKLPLKDKTRRVNDAHFSLLPIPLPDEFKEDEYYLFILSSPPEDVMKLYELLFLALDPRVRMGIKGRRTILQNPQRVKGIVDGLRELMAKGLHIVMLYPSATPKGISSLRSDPKMLRKARPDYARAMSEMLVAS